MKNTFIPLLILIISACERPDIHPSGAVQDYKSMANHGNHFGNAMQAHDSAEAYADYFQFPPLPSDSIVYHHLNYNTGVALYDTVTSS